MSEGNTVPPAGQGFCAGLAGQLCRFGRSLAFAAIWIDRGRIVDRFGMEAAVSTAPVVPFRDRLRWNRSWNGLVLSAGKGRWVPGPVRRC